MIERMREDDLDAVREVDSLAFWAWARQEWGEETLRFRRTRDNVRINLAKDPEGCFVAKEDGQVVGFVFSRTWGGVGWFGTFAVLPDYQGRRIGKELIAASVEYLRRDPERVVGLETMPQSPYNLGLYTRLGFEARFPTLVLSKSLGEGVPLNAELARWSAADAMTRARWLDELRGATGRIYPRLDYAKEIVSIAEDRQGEALVWTWGGEAAGVSVVRLVSSVEEPQDAAASVLVLAIDPRHTGEESLWTLTQGSEALAAAHGLEEVVLAVNARHTWALRQLLELGYRVERMAVQLVLRGTDEGPAYDNFVDLARWAG